MRGKGRVTNLLELFSANVSFLFMPRRRSATKTSGKKPRPVVRADGKTKKWNKSSDIPLDEEDECV